MFSVLDSSSCSELWHSSNQKKSPDTSVSHVSWYWPLFSSWTRGWIGLKNILEIHRAGQQHRNMIDSSVSCKLSTERTNFWYPWHALFSIYTRVLRVNANYGPRFTRRGFVQCIACSWQSFGELTKVEIKIILSNSRWHGAITLLLMLLSRFQWTFTFWLFQAIVVFYLIFNSLLAPSK